MLPVTPFFLSWECGSHQCLLPRTVRGPGVAPHPVCLVASGHVPERARTLKDEFLDGVGHLAACMEVDVLRSLPALVVAPLPVEVESLTKTNIVATATTTT